MPKDSWKRANDRAKYGPVRYSKRPKQKRKRIPKNFRYPAKCIFLVNIGTPALVIAPNGAEVEMQTRKTLRFGQPAKRHLREGHHTFHRRGFHLIVANEHVRRDTMTYR